MVVKLSDNIYSPLGTTTGENLRAMEEKRTALKTYRLSDGTSYRASLFESTHRIDDNKYTFFEQLCIASASDAIARSGIDVRSPRVRFFVSTTKANVHLLSASNISKYEPDRVLPGVAANIVSQYFGNPNPAVAVSNACISGVSAQIVAWRSIEAGICDYAVVIGCDIQSEFIVSGFNSLHALSEEDCRPFDAQRKGLNLGEAAATIVYGKAGELNGKTEWVVEDGVLCNDANHISGPSRTGEGSLRCLQPLSDGKENLAFISVHGTSTLYNDEMESIAIERAGLSEIPIFSLKGYYGHTMGAAGVLETILSMQAVEKGIVFATRGFEELGVSRSVEISAEQRGTNKRSFIKLMSGFGGSNAAMRFTLRQRTEADAPKNLNEEDNSELPTVTIQADEAQLTQIYRETIDNYPKYFKMDLLSKLGFVASELLLRQAPVVDYGVLLFNRSSSLYDDTAYQRTIASASNYYPSPSLFVYTLPNIVTGEIAIRHHFLTETNFMVLDAPRINIMAEQASLAAQTGAIISGWVECDKKGNCFASLVAIPQHCSKKNIEKTLNKLIK